MLNFPTPTPTLKCILGLLKQFNGLTSLIKGRHILPRQSLWHVMPIQFQNRLNKQSSKPNKQGSYMDITCAIYIFQWANFCNRSENTVSNTQRNTFFHTRPQFHTLDIKCEGFTALRQTYYTKYLGSEFYVTKTPKMHFFSQYRLISFIWPYRWCTEVHWEFWIAL